MRDGRARWKSENETNNVLKTKGYHLEHNFGHGKENLCALLATMLKPIRPWGSVILTMLR